jgi:hypothetical protein
MGFKTKPQRTWNSQRKPDHKPRLSAFQLSVFSVITVTKGFPAPYRRSSAVAWAVDVAEVSSRT